MGNTQAERTYELVKMIMDACMWGSTATCSGDRRDMLAPSMAEEEEDLMMVSYIFCA